MSKRPAEDVEMFKPKVSVKWGKELFPDVEVDLEQSPLVFKSQLFALTGVPPDRQKVMIKGGLLKDEDWGKQVPKEGSTVMLMGSAEAVTVAPPPNAPVFVEDLPESEQASLETKIYGSGLQNLGNTCYMNSVIQCLYSVGPLKQQLLTFQPSSSGIDPSNKLLVATKELFRDLQRGGEPFPPFKFLLTLREKYPQFAQTNNEGHYMQQDAEECWTNLLYAMKEKLKDNGGDTVVDKTFGIGSLLKLKCEESGEEVEETSMSYMLKCNINVEVNHLHQGIALGLKDDREKFSEKLGKTALFTGSSKLTQLPPYLTAQLMRFFYKVEAQQKAKILRKVSYPLELDLYEFCTDELKKQLDGPRAAHKAYTDRMIEEKKKAKNKSQATDSKPAAGEPASSSAPNTSTAAADAPSSTTGDVDMQDAAGPSTSSGYMGAGTGKYQLIGVLTHKGRSADSGHYTSWVKQQDGKWVLFDDDKLTFKTDEEILNLSGGGDWHMAYLLVYKAVTVPESASP